jgi:hypothetical protein
MSLDLRSLRIELTLDTICYEESGRSHRYLCEAVHLTCKRPDSKLVRYSGITHYKCIRVSFSETRLKRLLQISQELLAYHAEFVTIDRSTILKHHVSLTCHDHLAFQNTLGGRATRVPTFIESYRFCWRTVS